MLKLYVLLFKFPQPPTSSPDAAPRSTCSTAQGARHWRSRWQPPGIRIGLTEAGASQRGRMGGLVKRRYCGAA